jgi:hypothetical protein
MIHPARSEWSDGASIVGFEMPFWVKVQSAGSVYPRTITSAICLAGAIGSLENLAQALKASVNPLAMRSGILKVV